MSSGRLQGFKNEALNYKIVMKKLFVTAFSVCIILSSLSCFAASLELYIRNHPYTKPLFVRDRTIYAAADDVFPAVELKIRNEGRVLCGATPDYKGPTCPQNTAGSFLYINGRPVTQGVLVHHDKVWISLPVLAGAIGYVYAFNPETAIADLIKRVSLPASAFMPVHPSPPPAIKTETKKKESSSKEDKIKAEVEAPMTDIYSTQDPNTYEVRTSYSLVNVTDHDVEGVVAMLNYLDGYGKSLVKHQFVIGTMAGGAVLKKEDYWVNYTSVYKPQVEIELDWKGKKKD